MTALTTFVTLDKLHNFSVPQFPHLLYGGNNSTCSVDYCIHVHMYKTQRMMPRNIHVDYYYYVDDKMMIIHCCTFEKEND